MNDRVAQLAESVGKALRELLLVLGMVTATIVVGVVLVAVWSGGAAPPRRPVERPDLSRVPVASAVPQAFAEVLRDLQPEPAKTRASRRNGGAVRTMAFTGRAESHEGGKPGTRDAEAERI